MCRALRRGLGQCTARWPCRSRSVAGGSSSRTRRVAAERAKEITARPAPHFRQQNFKDGRRASGPLDWRSIFERQGVAVPQQARISGPIVVTSPLPPCRGLPDPIAFSRRRPPPFLSIWSLLKLQIGIQTPPDSDPRSLRLAEPTYVHNRRGRPPPPKHQSSAVDASSASCERNASRQGPFPRADRLRFSSLTDGADGRFWKSGLSTGSIGLFGASGTGLA